MKGIVFKIVIFATTTLFLGGCGPPTTDVTSSPDYNFSSFSGTVWKTKVKTALAGGKEYTGAYHVDLLVPKRFDSSQPGYIPTANTNLLAVFPPGIRLRIGRLIQDNGEGSLLWVTATLIDATNAEKVIYLDPLFLANNRFKARGPTSSTNWQVNPDMLEPLTNSQ